MIKDDEEDHLAVAEDDKKLKPEDDAYLAETGRILLDWLSLAPMASRQ
jgi:carboxyl-terminal processing protease